MIPTLMVCFFGAGLAAAACDPNALAKPPFDVIPTLGGGGEPSRPGSCTEAETESACAAALTCTWSSDRCEPIDFSGRP